MKKQQREVFQIVANEADFSLCSFCKYAESFGSCCEAEIECKHPLLARSWEFEKQSEQASNLGDCWGFRPLYDISFVADVIGIALEKGWNGGVSWWQNKKGKWKITGVSTNQ